MNKIAKVAYVHPTKFANLSKEEKEKIKTLAIEISVPSNDEIEVLSAMLGVNNDDKFWNPDNVYLIYKTIN